MMEMFVYLRDKVVEDDISVSLIGTKDDIDKIFANGTRNASQCQTRHARWSYGRPFRADAWRPRRT